MTNQPSTQTFPGPQANAANAYLRTRVMSASPEELRLMLLDGAIKFLAQGRESMKSKQHEGAYTGLTSCREIIFELLTTIRDDANAELAANARALYAFMYRSLVEGAHEKDDAKLGAIASLLDYERETWVMLMQKLSEERGHRTVANPAAAATSDAARNAQPAPAMAISVQG